jgi:lauroyl/myristoyl acyltransferase
LEKRTYEQFSKAILELVPDTPMTADEIQAVIKMHGLEHFKNIREHIKEPIEIMEIISRMERGQQPDE